MGFKVLSLKKIDNLESPCDADSSECPHGKEFADSPSVEDDPICESCDREIIAEAVFKDTLRQVLEMVEGIENPLLWSRAQDWNLAIQTIKQSLQQAIEGKEDENNTQG